MRRRIDQRYFQGALLRGSNILEFLTYNFLFKNKSSLKFKNENKQKDNLLEIGILNSFSNRIKLLVEKKYNNII